MKNKHRGKSSTAIDKDCLALAGEYAVASELCKRGIYSLLTFGNRKRTDLLVENEKGMLRIQVKTKQGREWPGVKGIADLRTVFVFVDFQNKRATDRPSFYILNRRDWTNLIRIELIESGYVDRKEVTIDANNVPTWADGYVGFGVRASMVQQFEDRWDRVEAALR